MDWLYRRVFFVVLAIWLALGAYKLAHAQFVAGQPLTAAALNNALANPHITGGSVATSVITGNFLLSNFNNGTGATVNTCWLGNLSWGTCSLAGTGLTLTARTLSLTVPVTVALGGTGLTSGTSGGIPYYSSSSTIASSSALTANLPVIGGGAGAAPTVGTRSGNTTAFVTTTGAQTSGDCVKIDANGNHVANGSACGGGGGGGPTLITTLTAAPSASLSVTGLTGYSSYELRLHNIIAAAVGADFYMLTSHDNGVAYSTGPYYYGATRFGVDATQNTYNSTVDTSGMMIAKSVDSSSSWGVNGVIKCFYLSAATLHGCIWDLTYRDSFGKYYRVSANGVDIAFTTAIDAIKFQFSSGNIASGGFIEVWGIP